LFTDLPVSPARLSDHLEEGLSFLIPLLELPDRYYRSYRLAVSFDDKLVIP
jgi:hypothetical protein